MIKIAYSIWTFYGLSDNYYLPMSEAKSRESKLACAYQEINKTKKEINYVGVKQRVHIQRNL